MKILVFIVSIFLIPLVSYGQLEVLTCETFCVGPGDKRETQVIRIEDGSEKVINSVGRLLDSDGVVIAEVTIKDIDKFDPISYQPNLRLLDLMSQAAREKKFLCEAGRDKIFLADVDETDNCTLRPMLSNF